MTSRQTGRACEATPKPALEHSSRPGSVRRTLEILEVVADLGGASAKEIADATGLPLPTVYRLVRELLDSDYLVHIREERRFELGYKLHQLGVSLHQ
jgi:IclR family transcriptional regulator, acetate operon repressor